MSVEIIAAGQRLVAAGTAAGVTLRMLGGAGVVVHCPQTLGGQPHRTIGDLDVIVAGNSAREVTQVFEDEGFEPDRRFNAMQGDRRMIFNGEIGKVDVFIDRFEMCHRIDLARRLQLDPETITVSDLLLTKLQVRELTQKDVDDVGVLLTEHTLGDGPGDHVDITYLGEVVGDDWGLWRTSQETLEQIEARRPEVAVPARALREALDAAPKTRRFRMRAKVGERKRWYEVPDEIE
ncbi:MAG TPA: hypothetical protein VGM91_03220 [Conexibacter sp.]|jgi:hypothetical protein